MEKEIQNTSENISSIFNTNTNKSKEYDRQRYENNKQILEILKNSIEENKNLRFVQILWMLNIVDNTDRFHEEPWVTIKRITNTIERNNKIKENINSKENIKDSDLH